MTLGQKLESFARLADPVNVNIGQKVYFYLMSRIWSQYDKQVSALGDKYVNLKNVYALIFKKSANI